MLTATPKLLLKYFKAGIITKLKLPTSQVTISDVPYVDRLWRDWPHYVVVPGHCRCDDGGGHGAQSGGALIRRLIVTVHIYQRTNYDQKEGSELALTRDGDGMEDLKEAVRAAFELTWFAGNDEDFLTTEAVRWVTNPATTTPTVDEKIIKGAVEFEASFATSLPTTGTTITLADVAG